MNTILLGTAETIDLIKPEVRRMIDNPGMYLCGDSNAPEATIPIASMNGRLYSMKIDEEMDPERFLETLTVTGPFLKDDD